MCVCGYLGPDLSGLLGVHHAHMLKVLECVLAIFLLGTDVLLQQTKHMTGLQGGTHTQTGNKIEREREREGGREREGEKEINRRKVKKKQKERKKKRERQRNKL